MGTQYTGLYGRGTLLKTLADNTSTATSQHWNEKGSRDSGSVHAVSPSLISRDETLEELNATDYKKSIFPNLYQNLDAKSRRPSTLQVEKTEIIKPKPRIVKSQRKSRTSIFDEIQHRNESQYQRIQAVAREQMALYEKHTRDMEEKIKRQREEIQKKAQNFLNKLADQEAKKKEEKIYSSSYGRIWRHHRVMQRRALNLEPMNNPQIGEPSGNVLFVCVTLNCNIFKLRKSEILMKMARKGDITENMLPMAQEEQTKYECNGMESDQQEKGVLSALASQLLRLKVTTVSVSV